MPRPCSLEIVKVPLPERHAMETRWRYDAIRGDRVESEASVCLDGSRPNKTIVTFTIDDTFPLDAAISMLSEVAHLFRMWGVEGRRTP